MELFLDLLRSVVYGVIEGITEWLPISSTGHMILAEQVLKFSLSAEFMEMFRVVIQLGAIMAVVVLYFKKLWPFCGDNGCDSGLAKHIRWPVLRLWLKIIVACLPAAVLGLLLDDWMDAHFYNSVVVAVMLIVYGIAFILIERRPRVPATTKLSRITYKQAIIIGAWQVLALIPGTSRSGATIIGGLLCGMSRACASQFTFFLAIPVMAGGRRRVHRCRGRCPAGGLHRGVCRVHHGNPLPDGLRQEAHLHDLRLVPHRPGHPGSGHLGIAELRAGVKYTIENPLLPHAGGAADFFVAVAR